MNFSVMRKRNCWQKGCHKQRHRKKQVVWCKTLKLGGEVKLKWQGGREESAYGAFCKQCSTSPFVSNPQFFLLLYHYILYSIFYYDTIYSSPFSIFTYCVYCLPLLLVSKFQEDKFEELKPRNKSGDSIIL